MSLPLNPFVDTLTRDTFFEIALQLTNQTIARFALTCPCIKKVLEEKDFLKKAAWSHHRKISFQAFGTAEDHEHCYLSIGIHFPELLNLLGSLKEVSDLPQINGTIDFKKIIHPIMRGVDSLGNVILTFRYLQNGSIHIAVLTQTWINNEYVWKTGDRQISLGAEKLNDPIDQSIILERLKRFLQRKRIGVVFLRSTKPEFMYGYGENSRLLYEEYPPFDESSPHLLLC